MAKTIFEKAGGTYTQVGDYMLPDLLPAEEEKEANIGIWAMQHKRYLKQHHKVLYYNLLTRVSSIHILQTLNNTLKIFFSGW